MSKRFKKNIKGVTLLVLVITIIVLLILAAVVANLALSDGGILDEARRAAKEWNETTDKEQSDLSKLTKEMRNARNGIYNGTDGSGSESSGGNAKPVGEITGEETTNTEVVDENGDKAYVPAGFTVDPENNTVSDGLVVIDKKGENADTVGNEFVWIPCTLDRANNTLKYDRYAFTREKPTWDYRQSLVLGTNGEYEKDEDGSYKIQRADKTSYYFHEAMSEQERESIEKYGGYYIGRYEVGTDSERGTSSIGNIAATRKNKIKFTSI